MRVADERDRAVAGDELGEPPDGAALDAHACGSENGVVCVAHGSSAISA